MDNLKQGNDIITESTEVKPEEPAVEVPKLSTEDVIPDEEAFQYLERDVNTCEQFKIEIKNLPRFASYSTVKKLLTNRIKVKPQKIKLIGNPVKFAFVAFISETDKETALSRINGFEWKSKKLTAVTAAPKQDPFVLNQRDKRSLHEDDRKNDKKLKTDNQLDLSVLDDNQMQERLNDQVCCYWKKPYSEQLVLKNKANNEFILQLRKDILRMISDSNREPGIQGAQESKDQLFQYFKNDDQCCGDIKASPVIDGYRNKCEFSMGKDGVVGFRLGAYKDGLLKVVSVAGVPIVSSGMKAVVSKVEDYFKKESALSPFDPLSHEGNIKQIMIRSNQAEQHLLMITVDVAGIVEGNLEEEKTKLTKALEGSSVTSIYFEIVSKQDRKQKDDRLSHVFGEKSLLETMTIQGTDLKFSVSPFAFFQINTKAAEVCYETIGSLFGEISKEKTLLLDICCGTGTIGISLANSVKKVIGIELSKEAVEDAKVNAGLNGVSNITFIAGRAEDAIHRVLRQTDCEDIIAVIDPPRAGLNASLMKAIRSAVKVSKLVYVSCDAKFAKQNLIDLCRPVSKVYRGDAFVFTKVHSIDMFPHTDRQELLFLYERLPSKTQVIS